jgi:hypothetical protein
VTRRQVSDAEFWAGLRKSAALVEDLPVWTQAGLVLSGNFEGGRDAEPVAENERVDAQSCEQ